MTDVWCGATPRAWQAECYPIAMRALRSSPPVRGVVHACTGAGKTVLMRAILVALAGRLRGPDWRLLVTFPSIGLVEQTHDRIREHVRCGMFYTHAKCTDAPVILACVDSLPVLADRQAAEGWRVGLWIADEVHRTATDTVQTSIAALAPYARLGLSATPFGSREGSPLPGWDEVLYEYRIGQAIEDGCLVPWVTHTCPPDLDAWEEMVRMIHQHGRGPGVLDADNTADADWRAALLREADIPAESIHYQHSKAERADKLARLESGDLRCLVHVDLLTEGVDLPWLRWLGLLRDRKSHIAVIQYVGRGLRRHPGKDCCHLLMPHRTPIYEALARDAELGDPVEAARRAGERAAAETVDTETPPPLTSAPPDADAVVARLRATVEAHLGCDVRENAKVPTLPHASATDRQLGLLRALDGPDGDRRRGVVRLLPESLRDDVRDVIDDPRALTVQAASDAIGSLLAVKSAQRAHRRAGHRGYYHGPQVEVTP